MNIETFLAGVNALKTRVELCHTEDDPEAPAECGTISPESVGLDMAGWPEDRDPDFCMVVVFVDDEFRTDSRDDRQRELSVSQIVKFLED